jgi:hypothetical protein
MPTPLAHPRRLSRPARQRPAQPHHGGVRAADFVFGLIGGHLAAICPACQTQIWPITTLGRAIAQASAHVSDRLAAPGAG